MVSKLNAISHQGIFVGKQIPAPVPFDLLQR